MKHSNFLVIALFFVCAAMAQNPVIRHPFTADPTIRRWSDGKFYIYGSHDKDVAGKWDMEDYHVFSSDDLVKWKDHGVVLKNSQTPWGGPFWAPDCFEKNGRYYFYFPEGAHIGVAESDSPTGPFNNPRSIYQMPDGYAQAYDPTVFAYKGKNYLIISERKSLTTPFYLVIFMLKDNMTEIEPGSKVELPPMKGFHEGPFVFERNGKIYLTGGGTRSLRYWMADDLFGPYESKGDFFQGNETFTISKTAHGSVINVDGQYYLAYHYDVFPGGAYQRTTCLDYMYFNEDGTIKMITPTRQGVRPLSLAKNHHAATSRFMSYKGLAMAGYQGWFNAPEDGAGRGWNHYTKNGKFEPGMCTIDMWPDMTEYKDKYKTPFKFADGKSAYTFSSYDKSTSDLHFKWMKEYGIDGVFMQRFVASIRTPVGVNHTTVVLENSINAATANDRAICIMYDLSGMQPHEVDLVIADWKKLVDVQKLTSREKNQYLYHRDKPLVAIWGIGFGDGRKYGYPEYEKLLNFFKNDPIYGGCSILLGVPTRWRELGSDSDKNPKLHEIIKQADIVQPWLVNRFNQKTYPEFHTLIAQDLDWCKKNNLDYVPVVFPGFSWYNMKSDSKSNQNPRNGGRFYWDQISNSIELGCRMLYYAMFDEIDEGTAIFKIENNPPVGESVFVGNEGLPSDHYLWLAGQGAKMMREEIPFTKTIPVRK